MLDSLGNYSGVNPFVFEILRGKRGRRSHSLTQKKILNFPLGVLKGGFDFPGIINYEVFLFSVVSKKGGGGIKSKPGLLDPH